MTENNHRNFKQDKRDHIFGMETGQRGLDSNANRMNLVGVRSYGKSPISLLCKNVHAVRGTET